MMINWSLLHLFRDVWLSSSSFVRSARSLDKLFWSAKLEQLINVACNFSLFVDLVRARSLISAWWLTSSIVSSSHFLLFCDFLSFACDSFVFSFSIFFFFAIFCRLRAILSSSRLLVFRFFAIFCRLRAIFSPSRLLVSRFSRFLSLSLSWSSLSSSLLAATFLTATTSSFSILSKC